MNKLLVVLLSIFVSTFVSIACNVIEVQPVSTDEGVVEVPLQGNSYSTAGDNVIDYGDGSVSDWVETTSVISSYFKITTSGQMKLSLKYSARTSSKIKVTCMNKSFTVNLVPGEENVVKIGEMQQVPAGYVRVDFQGIEKSGSIIGYIKSLLVSGAVAGDTLYYVNKPDYYYWGRRGPSVHMGYTLPAGDIEWFYNEVTVPIGYDPIGSYYMANGFGEGYFGMQVNSATERRVLFSVWSPYKTDNPNEIPTDEQVLLNKKGDNVTSKAFGGEGSGRQNFMLFPWKAGVTYPFLTHIQPDPERPGYTNYTGYIFNPESNTWLLVASNSRPKISTYYKRPHSFLENFDPTQGYITRKVFFGNQWAKTASGEWQEVTAGKFTYDATAGNKQRMDYKGGVEENRFFLQNCGFFSESTTLNSKFDRSTGGKAPVIDFSQLP